MNPENLTAEQEKEILDFWGKYQNLFPIKTIFHSFYLEKSGCYDFRFMPADIHFCYVDTFYNNWDLARVVDNKCTYARLFKDARQPETVFCRINGSWVDAAYQPISREQMLARLSAQDELVIKQASESEGGSNIFFIRGANMAEQLDAACNSIQKDIIVQKTIRQHAVMNRLNSSSVNTIRIISFLTPDGVKLYSAILRMGINESRVDNLSRGGIACGVNWDGHLRSLAYNKNGQAFRSHPTTGTVFEEITLPNFDKACDLVRRNHPAIPDFRLVSWDVCLDEDGEPLLVEANLCYGELTLHQLCNGPLFGDDTESILNEVFGRR